MSTVEPLLAPGMRLDRATFHARYEAMPEDVKAELIGGVVYMASPLGRRHGEMTPMVAFWLTSYPVRTPGVLAALDATTLLDEEREPQPDLQLRILPECGGRTRHEGKYIAGPPELVVEVADATLAIDLGPKREDYRRVGILEYVVVALGTPRRVLWHARRGDELVEVAPGADRLYRSEAFPGLWLDPAALLADDPARLLAALESGLATPEHAAFVDRLAQARGGA